MKKYLFIVLLVGVWSCEDTQENDTTPPTISISSPVSGQTVYEIVNIIVQAQDNKSVDRVEFYVNDSLEFVDNQSTFSFQWNTTVYPDDSDHIIKAIAYDNSDNFTESQPILLKVNNIGKSPAPVFLKYQNNQKKYSIDMIWNKSSDPDFEKYIIYKSNEINRESIWECISWSWYDDYEYDFDSECVDNWLAYEEIQSAGDTTFTDSMVTPSNTYFYKIVVSDTSGLESSSNVRYFYTRSVDNSHIKDLNIEDDLSISVFWDKSIDSDFYKYELYRIENSDTAMIYGSESINDTVYQDQNTSEFGFYSYFVKSFDQNMNFSTGSTESISAHLSPAILNVPSNYFPTIQTALDASNESDVVLVSDGVYYENLYFPAKNNIKLKSVNGAEYTTIDGSRNGSVITVISYVIALDTTNSIEGFTITNGGYIRNNSTTIYNRYGSGIYLHGGYSHGGNSSGGANILIRNNIFKDNINSDSGGGGIYSFGSSPVIEQNIFENNIAGISVNGDWGGNWYGGAIMAYHGNPKIRNCIFNGNQAIHSGGALRLYETENILIENCVFNNNSLYIEPGYGFPPNSVGNTIDFYGDNIEFNFMNCIFTNSGDNPLDAQYSNPIVNITYTLGDFTYQNNYLIESDPLFIDEIEFRLNSNSPAIDAGNPSSEYNDFDGSRNDIGAYGGSKGNW